MAVGGSTNAALHLLAFAHEARVDLSASTTSTGSAAGSEGHYDLVVGADGIHSSIRRLLVAGSPAPLGAIVKVAGVDTLRFEGVGRT